MDKSWITKHRLSQDYRNGVKDFLDFAFDNIKTDMIKCPCQHCSLVKYKVRIEIEDDLICHGFLPTYTNWYLHGEELDFQEQTVRLEHESNIDHVENPMMNLLGDVFPSMSNSFDESTSIPTEDLPKQKEAFDDLFSDCNEALYEGCHSFSKLSFMLKLYHIKCMSRISDKGMSMIIDLLKEAFEHAKLPKSFNDMKKIIRKFGFNYENIHVCPNDCMLYWGDDASRDTFKVCESSRWKTSKAVDDTLVDDTLDINKKKKKKKKKKKQQAAKILRYFPLKPHLQRLFMSSKTAEHMRWHAESENKDDKLRHPRDGKAWKAFNEQYPDFASDPRNVRLGLATDGFNPFGSMSISYSVWPVFLFPYNFPPWMSMKQTSTILSMVIPGKHMPGNDIDIYLQPLIQELRELWFDGVSTFDASLKETFCMRAALLWTISDFPGLGNLSGWNIYTGLACPSCNYDAEELRLRHGKKYCFMGHRRFLPQNHHFRKDKHHFNGFIETRDSPITPSGTVILQQLDNVDVTLGKKVDNIGKKRRRLEAGKNQWRKISIFFKLPYWERLLLRHNLDVMHIEKNVLDNFIFTLLDDKGKSKDNLNARKDLEKLGIRRELWSDKNGKYLPACFTMTTQEKDRFLNILKNVKFPDGYSSEISTCTDLNQRKIVGLKSHDCHVLMGQLLSIAIRNVLPREVSFVVTELCRFFRQITSKVFDSKHKIPHALGRKSIARKSSEMEEKTGIEPTRAELFIASRTRSDGSLVCNEARISVDNLSQVMAQNIQNQALNNESRPNDAFEQVFGPEHPGRVRCVGHGPTPSKYFSNLEPTTANAEIIDMKTRMKGLEDKLDVLTNVLFALVGSKSHFQGSAIGGNTKFNTHLHPSSSINSDQESSIPRTEI